jgi:hypothetical protein
MGLTDPALSPVVPIYPFCPDPVEREREREREREWFSLMLKKKKL